MKDSENVHALTSSEKEEIISIVALSNVGGNLYFFIAFASE
jgi:hypothetical protein